MSLYSFRDDAMKLADKMSRSLWLAQALRSDAANMLRHLVREHGCLEARCDRLSKELDSARADVFNLQVETGEFYGQPRIDRAEAERDAAVARAEAAEALVEWAESIFTSCEVTNGCCCCGDEMSSHSAPMSSGHTPVDMGAFAVQQWMEARAAARSGEAPR